MSTKESTAPNRALSSILREVGYEAMYDRYGVQMTKNEALSRHLWDLILTKQTTLINELEERVVIKVSTAEWMDVIFRVIERMDGKASQPIEAVMPGVSLTRTPRFASPAEQLAAPTTIEYLEDGASTIGAPLDAAVLDQLSQEANVIAAVQSALEDK
jgi:hypothetical protein